MRESRNDMAGWKEEDIMLIVSCLRSGVCTILLCVCLCALAIAPATAQVLYVTEDGVVTGDYDNVFVGVDEGGNAVNDVTASYAGGVIRNGLGVGNFADFTLTSGSIKEAGIYRYSKLRVNAPATVNAIVLMGNSTAIINGGNVGGVGNNAFTFGETQDSLVVNGGVVGDIFLQDFNLIEITGGTVTGSIQLRNMSGFGTLEISGGSVANLSGSAAQLNPVTMSGGHIDKMDLLLTSFTLTGGSLGELNFMGGPMAQSGGSLDTLIIDSNYVLTGGTITDTLAELDTSGFSHVTLYGRGIQFGAIPEVGTFQGVDGLFWRVTGTVQDDSPLDFRYFVPGTQTDAPVSLVIVNAAAPEPGTLALMSIGCWVFYTKRKKSDGAMRRRVPK